MNLGKPDILNNYLRHWEVNNYLDYLGHRFPEFVTVHNIGKSFEGRMIKGIKIDFSRKKTKNSISKISDFKNKDLKNISGDNNTINSNNFKGEEKDKIGDHGDEETKWIFIEGGTHAREWLTIAVALYCVYELTENHENNTDILAKISFFIVPLVNSDGYEYTHDRYRLWRKNRHRVPHMNCVGIDCNRNYDFHWDQGASKHSKNTYRGEFPFSESETCAIRNAMQKLCPNLKLCLSLHSYAQSIMYPWAWTKQFPQRWRELHSVAKTGRDAIQKATGRYYRCGSISALTHKTYSGSIADYSYGVLRIPYVIVMELPSSKYGFQPPPEKIEDFVMESWIGINAMFRKVVDLCNLGGTRKNTIHQKNSGTSNTSGVKKIRNARSGKIIINRTSSNQSSNGNVRKIKSSGCSRSVRSAAKAQDSVRM